ncbi:FtsX-like permease family protein [Rubritalea tangerina]|uniref:FtsX-like permease family protein n=1 Tax=Rubritalea tangerina TaxID=430798 RepID=A0ABW4ZBP5_9BACT
MITLISLIGVSLGVMVLVVVMSVMDGFEKMVKERVLGESPHITIMRTQPWDMPNAAGEVISAEEQWRALEEEVEGLPSVDGAYPLVRDFVIVDMYGSVVPVVMRGIDTEDPQTMKDLKALEVAGDVGIGMGFVADQDSFGGTSEVGVISSIFAEENRLGVGDILEVISNRNIKQLKPLLERKGAPSAYEQFQGRIDGAENRLGEVWTEGGGKEQILYDEVLGFREFLTQLGYENLRSGERDLLTSIEQLTKSSDFDDDYNYYPVGRLDEIRGVLKELKEVDVDALDREEELQLNELALPKEVRISGIYRADRFAPGPPLLVPLHLAQELAGVGTTGGVNGVALRLKDPYLAASVLEGEVQAIVPEGWKPVTWMQEYQQQFALISMQKIMMTLALSFIVLIAVFSIGAVMFTVTIQKKREIGVMKALGATPQQVTQVFALQGVIVGCIGALIGVGLSLLVLYNLEWIQGSLRSVGFDPFSKSFYGIDVLPHTINPLEITVVCVLAFILCSVAAYAPAWVAARADAARSLRNL